MPAWQTCSSPATCSAFPATATGPCFCRSATRLTGRSRRSGTPSDAHSVRLCTAATGKSPVHRLHLEGRASAEYDQRVRTEGIWLRFLSGPDIESLGISRAEIIDAVAEVVTAHGRGRAVAADAGTMLRYH